MGNIFWVSQAFFQTVKSSSDYRQIRVNTTNPENDRLGASVPSVYNLIHEATSNYKFKNILSLIMNILNPLYLYGTSTRNSKAYKYLKRLKSKKFTIFLVKSCEIKVVYWTKPSQCVFTKFFKLLLSASSSYSRFYIFIFLLFFFLFRDLVKLHNLKAFWIYKIIRFWKLLTFQNS